MFSNNFFLEVFFDPSVNSTSFAKLSLSPPQKNLLFDNFLIFFLIKKFGEKKKKKTP
jgi:hypothetical protein